MCSIDVIMRILRGASSTSRAVSDLEVFFWNNYHHIHMYICDKYCIMTHYIINVYLLIEAILK